MLTRREGRVCQHHDMPQLERRQIVQQVGGAGEKGQVDQAALVRIAGRQPRHPPCQLAVGEPALLRIAPGRRRVVFPQVDEQCVRVIHQTVMPPSTPMTWPVT